MKLIRLLCSMFMIVFMLVILNNPANAATNVKTSNVQKIITSKSIITQGTATKDQMAMNGTNYIRVNYTKYSSGTTTIDSIDRAWSTDGDVELTDQWVSSSSATAVFWDNYHKASYTLTINASEIP